MRAEVVKAYFDRSGLHKPGEVVEVDRITDLVKPLKEVKKAEKVEEPETTEEEVKPKKVFKKKK